MSYLINNATQGFGLKIPVVGGEIIGDHKLIYIAADGKCYLTDAGSPSTMPAIGISCGAIEEDGVGEVLLRGIVCLDSWDWTMGGVNGLLYASTQAGELTHIKPSSQGEQIQIVGIAITADLILFSPTYTLKEVE